jgi:hypothetical protein
LLDYTPCCRPVCHSANMFEGGYELPSYIVDGSLELTAVNHQVTVIKPPHHLASPTHPSSPISLQLHHRDQSP